MNPELIRLLIVDDHAMVREGLARMLEKEAGMQVAGQCASLQEALPLLQSDVTMVLLDVDLGSGRAPGFIAEARGAGFGGQILILTAGISGPEAVHLIQAGVSGIVHKHHSSQALADIIRQVHGGQSYIEPEYITSVFRSLDRTRAAGRARLSERECAILKAIFQGLTNREIAARVQVPEGTLKASIRQLFDRLGVRTRAQAVKVALEQYRDQL